MIDTRLSSRQDASNSPSNSSLHAAVFGTCITCMILVSTFTSARFIAKRSVSSYNIEDYLLMITWPMLLGFAIALMMSAHYGVGHHIWNIAPKEFTKIQKTEYAIDIFYALTTWCGKTALLFQMQRIFSPTRSGFFHIASYVLIVVVAATYSVVTLALILQCLPVRKVWDPTVKGGHCLNEIAMSIATGVINVVTDFTILVLPMWAIFRLNMPLRRKFTVSAIFATGILACACSLCRMVYSFQMEDNSDYTISLAKLGVSAVCEITSIILCTCFPLMPRFVQVCKSTERGGQLFPGVFAPSRHTSPNNGNRKTLSDDSCVFCDRNTTCAIHLLSNNTSKARPERDQSFDDTTPVSPTIEHRDSDTMQVEDSHAQNRESGSIMVQQRFEVEHGVRLNDSTRQQHPMIRDSGYVARPRLSDNAATTE